MRTKIPAIALAALAALLAGCSRPGPAAVNADDGDPATRPETEPGSTVIPELAAKLGQRVTFEGLAVNMFVGAGLQVGDHVLHMDGLDSWPEGYYEGEDRSRKVRVTGTLIERHDLPVFIQEEGAPIMHGMPQPPGTDLHQASRRYLLTDFTYEPIP